MIRILIVAAFFVSVSLAESQFCEGFYEGVRAGICYNKTFCNPSIPSLCPIPHIGQDSWRDGYNRGFLVGLSRQT